MIVQVDCPAKINPFLSVGPPNGRGYHPIRTVFQAISLRDRLTVEVLGDGPAFALQVDGAELPTDNTVARAARLLGEFWELPPLRAHLDKHIPVEAGLGGGSSDAAGMLRLARALEPDKFRPEVLQEVAMAIGADVPFFLVGGRARAEGYGERLTPLEDEPVQWLVVAKPDVGCSTREAYAALDAAERSWRDFPADLNETYNDFERVMPCASDDWMEHLQLLGAEAVGLCGSGSAVWARFDSEAHAERAAEDVNRRRGVRGWAVHTLTRPESLQIRRLDAWPGT